tara:strand:+ start:4994 stop:5356 length:363 start_codon:yes stop_codon:yes gene_type:complete
MNYATPILKINKLINEFQNCHNTSGALSFFRNSPEGYFMYLLVMNSHYNEDPICVETLINLVCPKFCSRQTVKNIISTALEFDFLKKTIDEKDHRRKLFVPSQETIDEFEIWINQSLDNL